MWPTIINVLESKQIVFNRQGKYCVRVRDENANDEEQKKKKKVFRIKCNYKWLIFLMIYCIPKWENKMKRPYEKLNLCVSG